jgi:hypothetical protein
MFRRLSSVLLASSVLFSVAAASTAQTFTPEQRELWKLEEQQWKMSAARDHSWIEKLVHPNMTYWDADQPAPQNRSSLARWQSYYDSLGKVVEQEIFPISATITGDVAVLHYRYAIARENSRQEREIATGRYTDVFLRENGRWLFIAWAGGDDPKK